MSQPITSEPGMSEPSAEHDLIAREIVDAAFAVHARWARV